MKTIGPSFPTRPSRQPSPARQQDHLPTTHHPACPHRKSWTARPTKTNARPILSRTQNNPPKDMSELVVPAQPPFPRWAGTHQAICFTALPPPCPDSIQIHERERITSPYGPLSKYDMLQLGRAGCPSRGSCSPSPLTHSPTVVAASGRQASWKEGPMETKQSSMSILADLLPSADDFDVEGVRRVPSLHSISVGHG